MLKFMHMGNNKHLTIYNLKDCIYFAHANTFSIKSTVQIIDMQYQGKTYKWKINKNKLNLTFNRANKTKVFFKNKLKFLKILKNKYRLFVRNKQNLFDMCKILKIVRKPNIFTHRGIKLKNNYLLKKKGKISSYKNV